MAARKTRKALTAEADRFDGGAFQPPQARSGMMKVAGASDADHADEQLITDVDGQPDEYKGNDSVGAPFYAEGRIFVTVRQLREMVRRLARRD